MKFGIAIMPSEMGSAGDLCGASGARAPALSVDEILENIGDGFVWVDADLRVVYVNAAAERMLGQTRAELIGRPYLQACPELGGEEIERRYRQALAQGETVQVEQECDGRRFEVRARSGRSGGLQLYWREITESRRVEEELRQSAHRLAVALRESPIVVFTQDANLRYTWIWSPHASFCSAALGKTDAEAHAGGDSDRLRETKLAVLANGQAERHEFYFKVEGAARVYDMTLEPLRNAGGAVIGITGAAIDITESKTVEQHLRETNIRMRLALDSGQMATWDWDLRNGSTTWSERHYRMLGLKPGEAQARYETWFERVHPADRDKVAREIERSRTENRLYHVEYRVVWPDGSVHWLEGRGQFFQGADGNPVRMTGVVSDITERRNTEEALQHRQKLEGIGLLAGGIAHDFNNLLTGILGGASYSLDQLPPHHAVAPVLRMVVQSSERAALLTRQLLAYAGRGRFLITRVQLDRLAQETAAMVRGSFSKNVQWAHFSEPELPAIDADPGQMQQLVMNLLINAGESIGEQAGGAITVRTSAEEVNAERARREFAGEIEPGRYAVLEVADTGCGMDAETLAKIFDPFFTTKFTGRGLGLAAAQGIVRGHHGAMRVESEPGHGSRFRIFLPAAEDDGAGAAADANDKRVGQEAGRGKAHGTILVVDDEDMVRRVAHASLEFGGFQVLEAADGEEALAQWATHRDKIALVLLDMDMPGLSGVETLRSLRERGLQAPVLVSSGFSEMEVAHRFQGVWINGVIEKPFRAAELVDRVRAALA